MDIQLAVIYGIFLVLGGSFGSYLLKIWLSRNDEITRIKQERNNVKEYHELRDRFLKLQDNHRQLKRRFITLKDDEVDLEDLELDPNDDDEAKLSKVAKAFGVPAGLADALDNEEFTNGVGQLLKKNSGPVLEAVDKWLSTKTSKDDHNNIGQESLGV